MLCCWVSEDLTNFFHKKLSEDLYRVLDLSISTLSLNLFTFMILVFMKKSILEIHFLLFFCLIEAKYETLQLLNLKIIVSYWNLKTTFPMIQLFIVLRMEILPHSFDFFGSFCYLTICLVQFWKCFQHVWMVAWNQLSLLFANWYRFFLLYFY